MLSHKRAPTVPARMAQYRRTCSKRVRWQANRTTACRQSLGGSADPFPYSAASEMIDFSYTPDPIWPSGKMLRAAIQSNDSSNTSLV